MRRTGCPEVADDECDRDERRGEQGVSRRPTRRSKSVELKRDAETKKGNEIASTDEW